MPKLKAEQVNNIKKLHSLGYTNRSIAKELNLHHKTIASYLNLLGLNTNGTVKTRIKVDENGNHACSSCGEMHEVSYYWKTCQYISTCNKCRYKQYITYVNNDELVSIRDRYNALKRRAKKSNIIFTITLDQFLEIWNNQNGYCFYTGIKMINKRGNGSSRHSVSIDKIDPKLGYINGNVVFCTLQANTMKTDLTLEELKLYIPLFYEKVCDMWRKRGLTVLQCAEGLY